MNMIIGVVFAIYVFICFKMEYKVTKSSMEKALKESKKKIEKELAKAEFLKTDE